MGTRRRGDRAGVAVKTAAKETPIPEDSLDGGMNSQNRTRVREVMSTPLETIAPDASVPEAAEKMHDREINALVVRTSPRSIVSSSDIIAAVAQGEDITQLAVSDVMTTDVETVTPDLYMEEVAAMMTTYGIKHLPVVDDDYVGMVSSTDVTAHLS
ncbi:CBS domain protein [Halalkaliarchaeum desulfuricum]|uniref:CBS domain protein n=2 Tax=Halalkaliarchaeum desulfuricum TaxID=2055893 RepID=A0A343TP26_9EURY|nr:CBS domain protein [Halalkaliarchaeum desulfuricum]